MWCNATFAPRAGAIQRQESAGSMLSTAVRTVVIWAVVAGAAGFSLAPGGPLAGLLAKPTAAPAAAAAAKPPAMGTAANELSFRRAADGHFYVDADVNGARIHFLVDTGATVVVLSADDARAAGIRLLPGDFSQSASTANGTVRAAPVTLREVDVQQLSLFDVPAAVMQQPMPVSLLGMSFLSRLQGYQTRDDQLVMLW